MKAVATMRRSALGSHQSSLSAILALILVTAVVLACRFAESLTGDPKAGTVSSLWPDVPPFAGAEKVDLEIPLGARLAIRAFMQGKVNFIAFTTDQSAPEVQAFYSNERMKAAGWTPSDKGCVGDSEDKDHHGAVCLYKRGGNKNGIKDRNKGVNKNASEDENKDGIEDKNRDGIEDENKDGIRGAEKEEGLAIVVAYDEKTTKTQIFYVRIDLTQPTPSPSR